MKRYVLRRLAQAVVVLWLLTVIVFVIARLSGSPVNLLLPEGATPAERSALTHDLGLDRPLPVQYAKFVGNAAQGDFGQSTRFQAPALRLLLHRVPASIELALAALALAVGIGVPLGIVAALRRGRIADHGVTTLLTFGQATPSFWLGILLILWFAVDLRWFPLSGRSGLRSLVLPAVTLSIVPLVTVSRITRSSLIAVLPQDYVRSAEAKGLRYGTVLRRYVLRNGLLPIVTVVGLLLAEMLSGAVIVEQIFSWPGIGRLAIESISSRDYPVVQAVTLITSVVFVVVNLLVDLLYFVIDPRIRHGAGARA